MSDFKYTEAQEKAIKTRDKNIIISAAAGSGKTRVLVDRVISLVIEEKVDIDKMIIVTFTNKASIEMKDRIRKAFEAEMNKKDSDSVFLKKQIKALKSSHIQTLHAFCSDMLRENFYLLDDLSPSFKVANENQTAILKRDSINEVFDQNYEAMTDDFETFLHNFASSREDSDARRVIEKTYEFINSQVKPIEWLDSKSSDNISLKFYIDYIKEKLQEILDKVLNLINFTMEKSMRDKYKETFESDYNLYKNLYNILDSNDDLSLDNFIKSSKLSYARLPGKSKDDNPIEKEYVKNYRNSYKKDYEKILSITINSSSKTLAIFKPIENIVLKEIDRLTKEFIEKYRNKKLEKNYLDFTDMEHKFIELLDNKKAVEKLKEQFIYIFFDEYQDSNEIQNYIIEKLKRENNLFFVGDVKQSIYGFRLAEPSLFLNKLKVYEKDKISERIDLNENFRTDEDLIRFNNYIFDNLITEKSSNIDYKNGGHRLNAHFKFDEISKPKIEISALSNEVYPENHVVSLIKKIVADGFQYRDIAILFRSSSRAYKYEDAFKKADIPFFSDISKLSFDAVEVTFFINILKYIQNPNDDINLLAVMRSSIFKFTEDDIGKIRISSDNKYFYKAFHDYAIDDEVYQKKINFQTIFYDFSYNLSLMNLYEFGNYIFEKTSYYKFLTARDRGEERVKNVESFIDMMADFDENNDNGLYGFLSYIDNLKAGNADNLQASRDLSENENLVRLMTIHKSKGLEFPVVILAEADKTFNMQNSRSSILFDKDLGLGINIADYKNKIKLSSIRRDMILEKSAIDDKREEMRILYVALTRAINKMYIVGKEEFSETRIKSLQSVEDYLTQSSYMDWIISILMKDKIMQFYNDNLYKTNIFDDGILAFNQIIENEENDKRENSNIYDFINDKNYDEKLVKEYQKIFDSEYDYIEDTKSSLKKSVTEISKNFEREEEGYEKSQYNENISSIDYRIADFISDKKVFKALDRGTIIHKAFQNLKIKSYNIESLNQELEKLIKERKISKDELEILDKEKMLEFFNAQIIQNLKEKSISIRTEESFLMKYQDSYVNGQIDLMFELEDEVVLLDFKTDTKKREGFYNDQLKLYKKAIEESLNKKVTSSYIYWYNFKEFEKI